MSRRKKRTRSAAVEVSAADGTRRFQTVQLPVLACLAGLSALVVATPLVPGEGAAELGSGNLLAAGWITLTACWMAILVLQPNRKVYFGAAMLPWMTLSLWHLVSMLVHRGGIHLRPALNMTFVWFGAACCVFAGVQLFQRKVTRQAIVALLIALASGLSMHGFHQYFVSMPRTAAAFKEADEDEKQRVMRSHGLDPSPDAPDRKHFLDRLEATEPFATFGLANSLAGFLAPVIILTLGVAWRELQSRRSFGRLSSLGLLLFLMLGCLTLTKSRTAYVALAAGLVVLVYLLGFSRKWDWRWLLGGVGVVALLVVFGVVVGALDIEVLSESSKSLKYRLEYWAASASMVAHSPFFGCGPGQFQPAYAAYKLPQASETIADPHNFLVEMATTVGIPGLIQLLMVTGLLAREYWRPVRTEAADRPTELSDADTGRSADSPDSDGGLSAEVRSPFASTDDGMFRTAVNVGGGLGVLVAITAGATVDHVPDLWAVLMILVSFAFASAWMWGDFELPRAAVSAALVTWAINLLAAGGLNFPSVAIIGWLLLAILVAQGPKLRRFSPSQGVRLVILAGVSVLVLACMQWASRPLKARTVLNSPLIRNSYLDARRLCLEAAAIDPFWADPWGKLAAVEHQRWLETNESVTETRFDEAVAELLSRDPLSWSRRMQVGHWQLAAWRMTGERSRLKAAGEQYEAALERYPNSIYLNAQAAWAAYLAGDVVRASELAERALKLDADHPHQEHRLVNLRIYDPHPTVLEGDTPVRVAMDAEPLMQKLRKGSLRPASPQEP